MHFFLLICQIHEILLNVFKNVANVAKFDEFKPNLQMLTKCEILIIFNKFCKCWLTSTTNWKPITLHNLIKNVNYEKFRSEMYTPPAYVYQRISIFENSRFGPAWAKFGIPTNTKLAKVSETRFDLRFAAFWRNGSRHLPNLLKSIKFATVSTCLKTCTQIPWIWQTYWKPTSQIESFFPKFGRISYVSISD